jgi:hypothetical protein
VLQETLKVRLIIGERLAELVSAANCFAPPMRAQFRLAAELDARAFARSQPSPVRTRINSRSNSPRPPSTVEVAITGGKSQNGAVA